MKILCFGSLNLDMVYDVDHFVAPGETLSSLGLATFCGGKGLNQSLALARAGAEVYHGGMVGLDGAALVERLQADGVDVRHIRTGQGATGHAIIQVDSHGQNCILLHGGTNRQITPAMVEEGDTGYFEGFMAGYENEPRVKRFPFAL